MFAPQKEKCAEICYFYLLVEGLKGNGVRSKNREGEAEGLNERSNATACAAPRVFGSTCIAFYP